MATPQGPEAEVGEQAAGGAHSRRLADVKAGLRIDTQQLAALNNSLKESRDITREWRLEMEKLAKAASTVKQTMSGAGGGRGGNAVEDGFSNLPETDKPAESATAAAVRGGGMARAAGIMGVLTPIIGGLSRQLDSRIDRGIAYATSADRLNLLTQQMTGMSQMSAMNQRRELTPYRLGMGGINEMISFQSQTGIQATAGMARSIEAIRTTTGFTKTTADILNEQRQLMDPAVANRMFFMGGVNAYNIGGGMKDPMQMRQEIVQRMGLNNAEVMRSALNPGSITRARMADLGLGEEMQTEILQYAQQNLAFQERGGRGMYDPSKASHRQRMGIEENLATQQEETDRATVQREEQFMRRQIDNMASLEKSNQALIEAMGSLEDTMSGLIGARISSRPLQKSIGGALGGIGTGLFTAGAIAGATPAGWAMMAAGGAMMLGSALGDGDSGEAPAGSTPTHSSGAPASDGSRDNELMVPSAGRGSPRIPLSQFKKSSRFTQLDGRLREKLLRMMRENPNVGINSGYRSAADQERLFYKQMEETTAEQSQVEWNGKHWKSKPGFSFTAPPGRSMHETGLAADIFEDGDGRSYAWIVANSARFGLNNWRAKGWRHDEPWHVQPTEVPRYRSEWDRMTGNESTSSNVPAGSDTSSGESDGTTRSVGGTESPDSSGFTMPSGALFNPSGMSIQEAMATARDLSLTRLIAGGSGGWNDPLGSSQSSRGGMSRPTSTSGRQLTGEEVARLAYNAGFRGQDLVNVVAISKRESGWNTGAYNPNRSTGDDSYGLMQINMLGEMGPARLKMFGISSNSDLYNPQTNMNAAFVLYKNRGNKLDDWGAYKGEANTYSTNLVEAQKAVTNAGFEIGDPIQHMPSRRSTTSQGRSGGTTNHITSAPTINVAPVINFNGTPSTPDLRNIAQTVSKLIKQEVDMLDLRTA